MVYWTEITFMSTSKERFIESKHHDRHRYIMVGDFGFLELTMTNVFCLFVSTCSYGYDPFAGLSKKPEKFDK